MTVRFGFILVVVLAGFQRVAADDTLYRYEADEFSPCHASHGWQSFRPCEDDCSDSVEDGHYVLRFAASEIVFYNLIIATTALPPPR